MGEENKEPVDEFHKHELMDRASFITQILGLLDDHPAHTDATRKAHKAAVGAAYDLYQAAANERFLDAQ
jgi:hypothetical protein